MCSNRSKFGGERDPPAEAERIRVVEAEVVVLIGGGVRVLLEGTDLVFE